MTTCKIGVTGTIGSGKSLIGRLLSEQNIPVLDVDDVVHILLATEPGVQAQIRQRFGSEYLIANPAGGEEVDRPRLGKLVFQDVQNRRDLEKIVHPAVFIYSEKWIAAQHAPIAAVLIPLLFESGHPRTFQQVWSVICNPPTLRERLKKRSNLSDSDIDRRLAAQLSQEEKAAHADCVIDNSGTIEETRVQVLSLLMEIQQTIGLQPIEQKNWASQGATEAESTSQSSHQS